jgi:small subunit ribosomal protein S6
MADQNRAMYELMYVVNTVLNDDQIEDICDRVVAFIREHNGDVVAEERWGSRRLTYPIEKKRNGYYTLVHFRAEPGLIARLDRALRINDDVLRHMVLRYDAKMERHYNRQQQKAAEQAAEQPAEQATEQAAEQPAEQAEA